MIFLCSVFIFHEEQVSTRSPSPDDDLASTPPQSFSHTLLWFTCGALGLCRRTTLMGWSCDTRVTKIWCDLSVTIAIKGILSVLVGLCTRYLIHFIQVLDFCRHPVKKKRSKFKTPKKRCKNLTFFLSMLSWFIPRCLLQFVVDGSQQQLKGLRLVQVKLVSRHSKPSEVYVAQTPDRLTASR